MREAKRRKIFHNDGPGRRTKKQRQYVDFTTNYSHGELITLGELPLEVLEHILMYVSSPKDLLSCWNTSHTWIRALQSSKFYFKMTQPFVLPYLSQSDLLQCSSVSKFWNAAVDVCIQIAEDFDSNSRLKWDQVIQFEIRYRDLTRFVNTFTLTTNGENVVAVNPVPFRRVAVYLGFSEVLRQQSLEHSTDPNSIQQKNLCKFFDFHGHLIRQMYLNIYDEEGVSSFDKVKLVQSCLKRTPNLRILHVLLSESVYNDNDGAWAPEPNRDLAAFNVFISANPFPALEHLKVLKFGHYTQINREEYASIANAYSHQLVHFQFGFPRVDFTDSLQLLPARFSCLQKIVYLVCDESIGAFQFATFVQSKAFHLKHLTLEFCDDPNVDNYEGLVMAVSAASDTLKTLVFRPQLNSNRRNNFDIISFEQLRLPRLKALELNGFEYPSLEFLHSVCPALQKLSVSPTCPDIGGRKMTEQGERSCDVYSEHLFWTLLEDIQKVDVEYMFDHDNDLVDGTRQGSQIIYKPLVEADVVKVYYTRRGYEDRLKEVRAIAPTYPHVNN